MADMSIGMAGLAGLVDTSSVVLDALATEGAATAVEPSSAKAQNEKATVLELATGVVADAIPEPLTLARSSAVEPASSSSSRTVASSQSQYQTRYVYTYRYAVPARGGPLQLKMVMRPRVKVRLPSSTTHVAHKPNIANGARRQLSPAQRLLAERIDHERSSILSIAAVRAWERLLAIDSSALLDTSSDSDGVAGGAMGGGAMGD